MKDIEMIENIAAKFQQDLGEVIDEYAERLADQDSEVFDGNYKEWGSSHLTLMLVARDFMEMNFKDITGVLMPKFEEEDANGQ